MKGKIVFFIAIILGLLSAFLIYNYLDNAREALDKTEYADVVVAREAIPANTRITANMIELKKMPKEYVHNKAVAERSDLLNKVSLVDIDSGESILENRVIEIGESKEGLAYMIPEGKRAMSVAVSQVSGLSGMLENADRVDIISLIEAGNPKQTFSWVVLQDIEVISAGKLKGTENVEEKNTVSGYETVTLAVSLEESQRLYMASQIGSISFLLRSPLETGKVYLEKEYMDINKMIFGVDSPIIFHSGNSHIDSKFYNESEQQNSLDKNLYEQNTEDYIDWYNKQETIK